jgi:hypothetical protein
MIFIHRFIGLKDLNTLNFFVDSKIIELDLSSALYLFNKNIGYPLYIIFLLFTYYL